MKRMVITVTVPDDYGDATVADIVNTQFEGGDATVWGWDHFWLDHREGVVGPEGDSTAICTNCGHVGHGWVRCPGLCADGAECVCSWPDPGNYTTERGGRVGP